MCRLNVNTRMKAEGNSSCMEGKKALTNGLVFPLSSLICGCFGGAGEVLFTASESTASAAKLTQMNFEKVRYKTVARGGEKILIQSPCFKSHIPQIHQSVLIGIPFAKRVFVFVSPRALIRCQSPCLRSRAPG